MTNVVYGLDMFPASPKASGLVKLTRQSRAIQHILAGRGALRIFFVFIFFKFGRRAIDLAVQHILVGRGALRRRMG